MFECMIGHKDSVTCTSFSHDGKLVATGDMSGMVKAWRVADGKEIWSFECGDLEVCVCFTHSLKTFNQSVNKNKINRALVCSLCLVFCF